MSRRDRHRRFALALILGSIALVCSCHRAPAAKRYPFTGRVVSIDVQGQSAIIDGDAIPGFMDAMAMPYKIRPASGLSRIAAGDVVSAEVVVTQPADQDAMPDYWLENVKVTGHTKEPPAASSAAMHMPAAGEDVPDFVFTSQSRKRISIKQYRGKVLLVTFIYTRCPFPDFCPRMSGNFAEIYNQMATNPSLAKTHLLSISFDPERDTPKVLRDYGFSVARTHEASLFSRWEFAAPSATDLPKIADFFALTVKPEGGLITHNLSTAVISPDGKIAKWYHGSEWQVSDLIKDVSDARGQKP